MIDRTQIHWKRIYVESIAIVLSILLAFWIDAWWGEYQARKEFQQVLAALESGFSENLGLIDTNITDANKDIEIVKRFFETNPEDIDQIPEDQRSSTLTAMWRPATLPLNNFLLTMMLDAESLKSLENHSLQQTIADWRFEVAELDERRERLSEHEQDVLLELGRQAEFGLYLMFDRQDRIDVSTESMRRVRANKEITALVQRKILMAQLHVRILGRLREKTMAVIAILNEEKSD